MAFDGIVTKKICDELQNIIGYKIDKIYEPDKNTVLIGLYKKFSNLALLINISSNNTRICLTRHDYKNPTVAPNFCMLLRKHIIGFKIKDIYIKGLERVVFIDLENTDNPDKIISKKLIIELMGKHSNIILTNSTEIIIDSLRHTSVENNSLRDIYPGSKYSFPKSNKANFLSLSSFEEFYEKIEPCLTDEISYNISSKIDKESKSPIENTTNSSHSNSDLLNLNESNIIKFKNIDLGKVISSVFNGISSSTIYGILQNYNDLTISKSSILEVYNNIWDILNSSSLTFETYSVSKKNCSKKKEDYFIKLSSKLENDAYRLNYFIDNFYFEKEHNELFENYRNTVLNLILVTLKKYEKRLENIDSKLQECNGMDQFRLYGELITANLYKIPNYNLSQIELENYYNENAKVIIPLDKRYLPSYNAKRFFKKYNKLKKALEIVNIQKKETIEDINYLESIVYELDNCTTVEEISYVYDEMAESPIFSDKIKQKSTKKVNTKKKKNLTSNKLASFNPLKFKFDDYTILVGRNNKENDYLTTKFASKNDLWFHTKDIHGSHVILKLSPGETASIDAIHESARLAALHSKAKNSTNIPVDYCKVSFVKKPHGSKPGMVIYSNNQTIYIKKVN